MLFSPSFLLRHHTSHMRVKRLSTVIAMDPGLLWMKSADSSRALVQGSLLRTAAGLGWDGVFLLPGVRSAPQDCTRAVWTILMRRHGDSMRVLH